MTVLDHTRLTQATLQLDMEGIRRGLYSDKYFENVARLLRTLAQTGYTFAGDALASLAAVSGAHPLTTNPTGTAIGDLMVEAQLFTRRAPYALVAGIDAALAMLRHGAGTWSGDVGEGTFTPTWEQLDVRGVEDGVFIPYDGHPEDVIPVIKIRGRYRDFALLETPILGILTRASRVATAVYQVLEVSNGKPILFFPARFDLPAVQAVDGYAYWLAVQLYNAKTGRNTVPSVSTDAQARWWGGRGGGTIPHALIAAFFGDTAEAMVQFAEHMPVNIPRIALVDFNNDVVGDALRTLDAFWMRYRDALATGDNERMRRFVLNGVRLDTGATMRDRSMGEDGPTGVNPQLVRHLREQLDSAWRRWPLGGGVQEAAAAYCHNVKIAVTGGFHRDRIAQFEAEGVPVDIYGVGSSLLRNDSSTNTDFTMDVVRVQVEGAWYDLAKVGRRANENPDLQPVDLSGL